MLETIGESVKSQIKYSIPNSIRNKIHPRKVHAFCIGTPKSGTTSIAGLFDKNYRASHEPERVKLIHLIHKHYHGDVSDAEYIHWLKKRDKRIWLDLESNCFLGYRPDLLFKAYPDSKYILSIRSPVSWLDSMLNHTINYPPKSELVIKYWHSIFFKPEEHPFSQFDAELKKHEVYSIEAYLNYWANSVQSVLDSIPEEQLLIVKTHEFLNKITDIANFLNIDAKSFDKQSGHLNKAPEKYNLLELVDSGFLEATKERLCGKLIKQLDL